MRVAGKGPMVAGSEWALSARKGAHTLRSSAKAGPVAGLAWAFGRNKGCRRPLRALCLRRLGRSHKAPVHTASNLAGPPSRNVRRLVDRLGAVWQRRGTPRHLQPVVENRGHPRGRPDGALLVQGSPHRHVRGRGRHVDFGFGQQRDQLTGNVGRQGSAPRRGPGANGRYARVGQHQECSTSPHSEGSDAGGLGGRTPRQNPPQVGGGLKAADLWPSTQVSAASTSLLAIMSSIDCEIRKRLDRRGSNLGIYSTRRSPTVLADRIYGDSPD